jgi:hypothetical protein
VSLTGHRVLLLVSRTKDMLSAALQGSGWTMTLCCIKMSRISWPRHTSSSCAGEQGGKAAQHSTAQYSTAQHYIPQAIPDQCWALALSSAHHNAIRATVSPQQTIDTPVDSRPGTAQHSTAHAMIFQVSVTLMLNQYGLAQPSNSVGACCFLGKGVLARCPPGAVMLFCCVG